MNDRHSMMQDAGYGLGTQTRAQIDEGLRSYMLSVYNYVGSGLVLTTIVAIMVGTVPAVFNLVYGTPLKFVVMFGPIGLLLFAAFAGRNWSAGATKTFYWVFTAFMGASMAHWAMVATQNPSMGVAVMKAMGITAVTFGIMSIWGYTTKRSLAKMGSFLMMGVIGLFIAMIVNIFLASPMLHFVISGGGVIVFTLLIAFDTQQIKQSFYHGMGRDLETRTAVWGALSLYINVINLFQFLMMFLGSGDE